MGYSIPNFAVSRFRFHTAPLIHAPPNHQRVQSQQIIIVEIAQSKHCANSHTFAQCRRIDRRRASSGSAAACRRLLRPITSHHHSAHTAFAFLPAIFSAPSVARHDSTPDKHVENACAMKTLLTTPRRPRPYTNASFRSNSNRGSKRNESSRRHRGTRSGGDPCSHSSTTCVTRSAFC